MKNFQNCVILIGHVVLFLKTFEALGNSLLYSHILKGIHNFLNSCQRTSILNVKFHCHVSLFTSLLVPLCSVSIGKRRDIFNAALLVLFEIQSKFLFDIFFFRFKLGRWLKNNVEKKQ